MSWDKIVKNDYGQPGQLTVLDVDTAAAADVSSYNSTISMVFRDPAGTETTKTATFVTDGTDGLITYTIESGFITTAGTWSVRARVSTGTAVLTSERHIFTVLD